MKPSPKSKLPPLLAFGAHPDDLEFGCGGVLAKEAQSGRAVHMVLCSRGEAATHGTPQLREKEARKAAKILGATLEFIDLDGDAHLEIRTAHALTLAVIIRNIRPGILLAPTLVENQHPDHYRLGQLVRDAARLARYGGIPELKPAPPHAIDQLLFYAVTPDAHPPNQHPILINISAPRVLKTWTAAMNAHTSQTNARNYVELALTRARLHGLSAGINFAIALYPNDPLVAESLAQISNGARGF